MKAATLLLAAVLIVVVSAVEETDDVVAGGPLDDLNGITAENPINCQDALLRRITNKAGNMGSGVWTIEPKDGKGAFDVWCDQETDGGGWIVFQKRQDGTVEFYRGWNEYVNGFGNPSGEYWLGLERVYRLTIAMPAKMRVDMADWSGNTAYAAYSDFALGAASTNYRLRSRGYTGTAGDGMSNYHDGAAFSTYDAVHDEWGSNCAAVFRGAWWYRACHYNNLNGRYFQGGSHSSYADGDDWYTWRGHYYSMKIAQMKLK